MPSKGGAYIEAGIDWNDASARRAEQSLNRVSMKAEHLAQHLDEIGTSGKHNMRTMEDLANHFDTVRQTSPFNTEAAREISTVANAQRVLKREMVDTARTGMDQFHRQEWDNEHASVLRQTSDLDKLKLRYTDISDELDHMNRMGRNMTTEETNRYNNLTTAQRGTLQGINDIEEAIQASKGKHKKIFEQYGLDPTSLRDARLGMSKVRAEVNKARGDDFFRSPFAKWGLGASGLAATVFLFQQLSAIARSITSVVTNAENAMAKLHTEANLTALDFQNIDSAARNLQKTGLITSEKAIQQMSKLMKEGLGPGLAQDVIEAQIADLMAGYGEKDIAPHMAKITGAFREMITAFTEANADHIIKVADSIAAMLNRIGKAPEQAETGPTQAQSPQSQAAIAAFGNMSSFSGKLADPRLQRYLNEGMIQLGNSVSILNEFQEKTSELWDDFEGLVSPTQNAPDPDDPRINTSVRHVEDLMKFLKSFGEKVDRDVALLGKSYTGGTEAKMIKLKEQTNRFSDMLKWLKSISSDKNQGKVNEYIDFLAQWSKNQEKQLKDTVSRYRRQARTQYKIDMLPPDLLGQFDAKRIKIEAHYKKSLPRLMALGFTPAELKKWHKKLNADLDQEINKAHNKFTVERDIEELPKTFLQGELSTLAKIDADVDNIEEQYIAFYGRVLGPQAYRTHINKLKAQTNLVIANKKRLHDLELIINDDMTERDKTYYEAMIEIEKKRIELVENMSASGMTISDIESKLAIPTQRATAEHEGDMFAGIKRGLEDLGKTWGNTFQDSADIAKDAISGIGDSLYDLIAKGENSFGDLFNNIAKSFFDMSYQLMMSEIFQMMFGQGTTQSGTGSSWWSGITSAVIAGIGHEGGVIGKSNMPMRLVPGDMFQNAQKLHSGLLPKERPVIMKDGETVLPEGAGFGTSINFQMPQQIYNIQALDTAGASEVIQRNSAAVAAGIVKELKHNPALTRFLKA